MRDALSNLDGASFDVAVIGGGINGASTAQHLAAAGYRVLVVDKGDFGSGASSRSSRLLHCGLRYLAPGRSLLDFVRHPERLGAALRMARLGMEARSEFVRTSPARTAIMRLFFPIYRDGPYRSWQIDLAFKLLWQLGPKDLPLDYRRVKPEEARLLPLVGGLRDFDRLIGVASFREYQFDWPERVCIDAVVDAERLGAVARNYTKARLVRHEAGTGWRVELTDMRAQAAPVEIGARVVLTMAGVWIDELVRDASPRARRKVFGTKGCHIVVKLPADCRGLGIATLNSRNEPFYCIPWKQLHYFGPTETPYDGDPDQVFATDEETAWLVAEANRLLPNLKLTLADVRLTWAGVRPLTYDKAVPSGNRSRAIHDLAGDGLADAFAMTAGPVMTHRSGAREIVRLVAQRIAPSGPAGTPDYAPPATDRGGLDHAETLSDVLFRRRGTAWSGSRQEEQAPREQGREEDALTAVAAEIAAILHWDERRAARELADHRAELATLFRPGVH